MNKKITLFFSVIAFSGCATSTKDIRPQYVSPLIYKDYDCDQLASEMHRVSSRVSDLGGSIDKNAKQDKVATGVGMVLFWPALFFIDGDSPEAGEYARLRGEFDAMQEASVQKKCGLNAQPGPTVSAGVSKN